MAETVLGFRIEVKGTEQETSQLVKLGSSIDQIKARIKLLNDLQRKGIPLTRKQAKERQLLNTQLKASRSQYNALNKKILVNNNVSKKSTSFTKKMGGALKTAALSSLGLAAGIAIATRIIGDAVKTFIEFEKTNSKLEAVLGANEEQMAALSEQSIDLGSSTAYTATQVAELQVEYAKLGFPTEDILNMTEATLNGAAALGSDLGEQAALTGALLKQFGLDATEAGNVNDVLATAAANSALDFQKLSTALPIVGATANAVGKDLTETTALLGKLADRGLDASTSGTSLRNVFLELSKKGLTMEQAMIKINGSTDKAKTSMELFGKRGATTGLILADMEGEVTKLDESLVDVDGAAKDMADTMLNNLGGDITIFKSAWEGLILRIANGGGVFSKVSRGFVQGFTNILTGVGKLLAFDFNNFNDGVDSYVKALTGIDLGLDQITPKVKNLTGEVTKLNAEQIKANKGELVKSFILAGLSADEAKAKVVDLYQTKLKIQKDNSKEELNQKVRDDNAALKLDEAKTEKELKAAGKKSKKIKAFNEQLRKDEIADELEAQEEQDDVEFTALIDAEIKKQKGLDAIKAAQKIKDDEQFNLDVEAKIEKDAKEIEDAKIQAELLNEVERQKRQFQMDAAAESFNIIAGFANGLANNEIAEFDRKAREQLNSFVGTEAEKEALAVELDKKRTKLEKKAFEQKKKLDIAQVFINLAQEISGINANAAANPANAVTFGAAGISQSAVLTALAIGKSAANIGMIASQKFADGGLVEGASHDQGGIQMYQKGGQHLGEMEGNEYIISAQRTKEIGINNLDSLNFGKGSMNGFFADGGSVPSSSSISSARNNGANGMDMESLGTLISQKMIETVVNIPVVNNATETFDVARNVVNTESELKFG